MTLTIRDGEVELQVFRPDNDSTDREDADVIIPGEDLGSVASLSRNIGDWVDEAEFNWDYGGGKYPHGTITSGDLVIFNLTTVGEAGDGLYGGNHIGSDPYGYGSFPERVDINWYGWAYSPTWEMLGGRRIDWTMGAGDFVFKTMVERDVNLTFDDRLIAVDEDEYDPIDGIINNILRDECPEIDRRSIDTIDIRTDAGFAGETVLQAVDELIDRGGGFMYSDGLRLNVGHLEGLEPEFELDYSDIRTGNGGRDDDALRNNWRVDGGTGNRIDDRTLPAGEEPEGYVRVNENNPVMYPLDTEKNVLSRAGIWIRRDNNSNNDVRVRVQKENSEGTGPRDVEDTTKDKEDYIIGNDFLSIDGWWEGIRFAQNPLPENTWIIIDTNGETGHDIGLADGEEEIPAFFTEYPYNIAVEIPDQSSIDEFRRRDGHVSRNMESNQEARDIASAANRHNAQPENVATFEVHSRRLHIVEPGDLLTADMPEVGLTGEFLVMQTDHTYEQNSLHSTVSIQSTESI